MPTVSPTPLTRDDLYSLEQYAARRPAFRAQVLAHKKLRTVHIGPHMTLIFEDRLTVQYQVQEMLRRLSLSFSPMANKKGIALRVVPTDAIVRSDPALRLDPGHARVDIVPTGSRWAGPKRLARSILREASCCRASGSIR